VDRGRPAHADGLPARRAFILIEQDGVEHLRPAQVPELDCILHVARKVL
jgi:hypothetical protein